MAAGVVLGAMNAAAQNVVPAPDPLSHDNDPALSRFQKFHNQNPTTPLAPSRTFTRPPASGAGKTGFDSTNARKRKPATKAQTQVQPQAIAPGVATPAP